jgi:acetyl esterase/lipase
MNSATRAFRPVVAVVLAVGLVAGCAGSGPSNAPVRATAAPAESPTRAPTAATAPPLTSTSAPTETPAAVTAATDLRYESSGPLGKPADLDVYAPTAPGPWPVVVMFHGDPAMGTKGYIGPWALQVAADGFVVFVPTWGKTSAEASTRLTRRDEFLADGRQAACAVEFARAHAAEYGGDPTKMLLFGHSAGGNVAAQVAFAGRQPTEGCPGGATLGPISGLVTFEGDWLLADPSNDMAVATDPAVLTAMTPWDYLANDKNLRVAMLVSENPGAGMQSQTADPQATDSWVAKRDPTGALRRQFKALDALAGRPGVKEEQTLLYTALEAQGNPVSLTEMPGADHMSIGLKGRPIFLAAFHEVAGTPK